MCLVAEGIDQLFEAMGMTTVQTRAVKANSLQELYKDLTLEACELNWIKRLEWAGWGDQDKKPWKKKEAG